MLIGSTSFSIPTHSRQGFDQGGTFDAEVTADGSLGHPAIQPMTEALKTHKALKK